MSKTPHRIACLLAALLLLGPPVVAMAHVALDDHCDHRVPFEQPGSDQEDECAFLAHVVHAAPLVAESSVQIPHAGDRTEIVPAAPMRHGISVPVSCSAQRAPPRPPEA